MSIWDLHNVWGKDICSGKKKKKSAENIDELKIYKWACNWFMPSVAFWETTLYLDGFFSSECLEVDWVTYYVLLIIIPSSLFLGFFFFIYIFKISSHYLEDVII